MQGSCMEPGSALGENSRLGEASVLRRGVQVYTDKRVPPRTDAAEDVRSSLPVPLELDSGCLCGELTALGMLRLGEGLAACGDTAVGCAEDPDSRVLLHTLCAGIALAGGGCLRLEDCTLPQLQAASVMASCMYSLFYVHTIFMTGICAGFKKGENDTIDFGDIFIAESEYDYGNGKLDEKNELKKEYKGIECDFDLKTKMNTFIEEKHPETLINIALEAKNLNLMKKNPLIHFKPGACGSYVVANQGFMNRLIENNRKLRGLDMEGYGLYMASHMLGKKSLMIKSVSDFADSDKGDFYHKMCSYSSAWFLFEYLKYTY